MSDRDTTNLLAETVRALELNHKVPADVRWVGSQDFWFTWQAFVEVADIDYNQCDGSQRIASDLKVVGDDWWLERQECDGFEDWHWKSYPHRPDAHTKPKTVGGGHFTWKSLKEMQES